MDLDQRIVCGRAGSHKQAKVGVFIFLPCQIFCLALCRLVSKTTIEKLWHSDLVLIVTLLIPSANLASKKLKHITCNLGWNYLERSTTRNKISPHEPSDGGGAPGNLF